jgi:stearoyl-CoA desaturase (delta-9 desaturase)
VTAAVAPRALPAQNRARRLERRVALALVVVPAIAAVVGAVRLAQGRVSSLDLALCGGMYLVSSFGVTAGYHRLFSHKSFTATPMLRVALGVAAGMSAQGPLLFWVAHHRQHHRFSDAPGDPHSPHLAPPGPLRRARGFFRAHVGWTLDHGPDDWAQLVLDLLRDPAAFRIHLLYPYWVLAGLALPALVGGAASGSWSGAFSGLLWGGLVRIFLQYHATQSVNSIGHLWGTRAFDTDDESRNNALSAAVSLGEGWHNNHHAFPSSARHGLTFWQLDVTWLVLVAMRRVGWVTKLRAPTPSQIARRQPPGERREEEELLA